MAYLMTDMAEGGKAALQLQQTMAAAPDVQQAQANVMQEQQLKLQQDQATLEKTKLANILTKSNFEHSEDAMKKIQTLVGTDDYKKASDAEKARQISRLQGEAGQPEAAESSMKIADALELSTLNKSIKQADANARQIQNAVSVIDQMPDESAKESIERLPEASKKALIDAIGKENYDKMDGKQIKAAANELMFSASGKLGEMKVQAQIKVAEARGEALSAHWKAQTLAAIAKRDKGSNTTKSEEAAWKDYKAASSRLDRNFEREIAAIDKKLEAAETAARKSAHWYQSEAKDRETPEAKALEKIVKEKTVAQKKYMGELRIMAKRSGDEDEIDRVEALWNDMFAEEETPPPKEGGTKDVTENKGGDSALEAKALAWAKANPNDPRAAKYLKEKAGGEGGTHTPAPTAAPTAPAADQQRYPADKNPYVDSKGRPTGKAPTEDDTGSPLSKTIAPAISGAAKSAGGAIKDFTADAQKKFLLSKLADGTATPADKERARRLGLM